MKPSALLVTIAIAATAPAAGHALTPTAQGEALRFVGDENPCPGSTLLENHNGSFEGCYGWHHGGVVPPYYGAFAEGFEAQGTVCGVRLHLTTLSGAFANQPMDLYVWDSDGTDPTGVLSIVPDRHIMEPAIWPTFDVVDLGVAEVAVTGQFFIGYWGNWPGEWPGWYVGSDMEFGSGLPRTCIAPGLPYPSGWQDPSIIWAPTSSLGIGAFVLEDAVPVKRATWGAIKTMF